MSPAAASGPRSARSSAPPPCRAPTSSSAPPPGPARSRAAGSTGALGRFGLRPNADLAEVGRAYASLADAERRKAFLSTLHAVVDTDGQRVAALDRLYLAEDLAVLIVWGERDPIIPVAHGRAAHAQLPGSHLEVFPDAGHVPMLESPGRFAAVLQRFLDETEPASSTAPNGAPASAASSPEAQCARLDSNQWPTPPEGVALSS